MSVITVPEPALKITKTKNYWSGFMNCPDCSCPPDKFHKVLEGNDSA